MKTITLRRPFEAYLCAKCKRLWRKAETRKRVVEIEKELCYDCLDVFKEIASRLSE